MKKIIITGSNGLLGQTLVNLLLEDKGQYDVIGFSRGGNRSGRADFKYESIDLTDSVCLQKKILAYKPDVIVNTAAMTNVDACEENKTACDLLNIGVVESLKAYSEENGTHLIHISTDFIFDGKKGYYKETDLANPLSYYGKSKLISEEVLKKSSVDFTILRTILVYGKVFDMTRNNIVLWVRKMLEEKKEITIVNDQFRMPTYVEDLAMACKKAIDNKTLGVFNISSKELLSIYEIARQIADVFGLDKTLIKPISTETLNQVAPRPAKTGFDLAKTNKELGIFPKVFKEDLQRFKEKLM
ncbi:SDR family oxidoreductase [Tenacibaculum maritimum]|uniref:SDR family oxidoreductase n=1 Tax=Tenacibaculum maritimum TaxID=107401 RepID=UPI0012E57AC9|nr:SDR family oxidoreductase [Tenacibaculum maritimum]MCD9580578.1 SDR family oxidoreductase [Tenacibaculum maritimum]MCD9634523.1 SDR family oxidoreductase [Tenacibaculum maritimum]CAA0169406.1 putative dTDP-4-dehydrorhamnose reductase [Tenacibaculum maritimum]CAA0201248.1 putative dTDP-4-dehydrorhamnose reductase [Tenacibaculum maritimum]CAA0255918.1 putative dTDP-4-dehydrorhamnose reductase [Tenacibaculum maritimum]